MQTAPQPPPHEPDVRGLLAAAVTRLEVTVSAFLKTNESEREEAAAQVLRACRWVLKVFATRARGDAEKSDR